ncbi:hypothetical protein ADL35_05890, partial [Streptomyces sp. NRRL WC-3753]
VELRARALALLTVTLPYATLVTVLTAALLGAWTELPEALGLSYALLGAMTATGAWASARYAYAIPQEGNKNVAPGQAGLAWISVLGGMVVAVIQNGMGLMGYSSGVKYAVTGSVLLVAAGVDALSRRRAVQR